MKKYTKPEIEQIILLASEDVITASNPTVEGEWDEEGW